MHKQHLTHSCESETKTSHASAVDSRSKAEISVVRSIAATTALLGPHLICASMSVMLMVSANSAIDMVLAALLIIASGLSLVLGKVLLMRLSQTTSQENGQ